MIKVRRKLPLIRRDHGRQVVAEAAPRVALAAIGRIPRVSRLMALAIHFDRLIREGKVADQSELARLAHVTQPRMTQIMNLLQLAPDVQEELLHLPPIKEGKDPLTERDLRPVAALVEWAIQRRAWAGLRRNSPGCPAAEMAKEKTLGSGSRKLREGRSVPSADILAGHPSSG